MPEIKNTFTQGKMNKDLDERLIPNGQYRHALNVEVSTSEDSDSGTVQNILGNAEAGTIPLGRGYKCVGSIADEKNNKLYWFVHGVNRDLILEYDHIAKTSKSILVDLYAYGVEPFLKFTGNKITGINIIDDFLYWTDGDNEPKKVNIKTAPNQFYAVDSISNQSNLYVNGVGLGNLKEEHITVIKRAPLYAPLLKVNKASSTEKPIFEKTFPRFCLRYKYRDGEYSPFGPFTDVVFSPNLENYNGNTAYNTEELYNTAMSNDIGSINVVGFVRDDIPKDVIEIDILYKQEDSIVVYSVASISKTDDAWNTVVNSTVVDELIAPADTNILNVRGSYKISTENVNAALPSSQFLRPWDNVPRKALSQEIIGNRLVYGNYTQGYDFLNKPNILGGLEKRKVYSFPKSPQIQPSLKSQRDYQLGVVYGDKYGRETPVFTSGQASVKAGRFQTSVGLLASNATSLSVSLSNFQGFPDWVDYYKFYVKQTSGEYYNFIMDRAYTPAKTTEFENEENHIWISIPSSDRNKIEEQDYIIMKRAVVGDSSDQIQNENRYKVLGISNEAPESISYAFHNLGSVQNSLNSLTPNDDNEGDSVFNDQGARIDTAGEQVISISKGAWTSPSNAGSHLIPQGGESFNIDKRNLHVSWRIADGTSSSRYSVTNIELKDSGSYLLTLSAPITSEDADLANGTTAATLRDGLIFTVERKDKVDGENFSGKFFVKLLQDELLSQQILSETLDVEIEDFILATAPTYYMADDTSQDGSPTGEFSGVTGSTSTTAINAYIENDNTEPSEIHGGGPLTNTENEWEVLTYQGQGNARGFFIDAMHMAASNPSSTNYAKHAGQGWMGESENVNYPEFVWSKRVTDNIPYNGLGLVKFGWRRLDATYNNINADGFVFLNEDSSVHPTIDGGGEDGSVINGLEGIISAEAIHTDGDIGSRRWAQDTIYGTRQADGTYEYGGNYIHLSYLAPGAPLLHDGYIPDDVTINGENGIAKYLQGIWGGGVFSNPDGSKLGASNIQFVEMESNPNSENSDDEDDNPGTPSPNNGFGYDNNYSSQHNGQWKPTWNNISSDIDTFIENLSEGKKFRFAEDSDATEYTIISQVKEKHIYNHTSWRTMYYTDGDDVSIKGNNPDGASHSVERAVLAWANTANANNITDNTGTEFEKMLLALKNFGNRNNRRTCYIIEVNNNPLDQSYNPTEGGVTSTAGVGALPDASTPATIEFITTNSQVSTGEITKSPIIWEIEPRNNVELDIYYEAGDAIPVRLTERNKNVFAPEGCRVEVPFVPGGYGVFRFLRRWNNNYRFEVRDIGGGDTGFPGDVDYIGQPIRFYRKNGGYTTGVITGVITYPNSNIVGALEINPEIDPTRQMGLNWFNCFNFGNGIESNRIRDDFNTMQITNGAKASATLEEPYQEEQRKNGLIYSGIYNSNSATNNLNQFIMAEKITKDLNPTYGSIQKLFSRNTDLVAFCEDRVIKIVANKDALFNADGNPQLISSSNVLGQAVPFSGDYGISKNPESFAFESYRAYFTDKQRGAVLRLSMDGLTPISEAGMHDHFRDNLKQPDIECIGTYDSYKKQYNLTIAETYKLNLIKNAYAESGSYSTEFSEGPELSLNTALAGGANYSIGELPPNSAYGSSDYGGDEFMPISNRSFSHKVKLKHHPAISSYYTGGDLQPAWVEVEYYYGSGSEWTTNSTDYTNLFWEAEQQYGPQNPGEVGGVLNSGANWYINPGTNDSNTYDPTIGATAYDSTSEYYGEEEINFNGKIKLENIGDGSAYAYHELDGGVEFITGEWYMVDIYYDQEDQDANIKAPIIQYVLGSSNAIDQARLNNSDHTSGDDNYPEFSFGRVSGNSAAASNKGMQTFPVDNNKYRAIFKYDSNGSSDDTFKLQVYNGSFVARTLMMWKISPGATMSSPSGWLTNNYNWQSPHYMVDFINENTPFNAYPDVYYHENKLCFDTPANVGGTYWNQGGNNALWMPASSDAIAYTLRFKVQPLADDAPYNAGELTGVLNSSITNVDGQGLFLTNIKEEGDYEIDFYFDGASPVIKEQPEQSDVTAVSASTAANAPDYQSFQFRVNTQNGFKGAVSGTSVKKSSYFTGGSIDNWTFSGFNPDLQDSISWDQQAETFAFNVTDGVNNPVQMEQYIGDLQGGVTYQLTLKNQLTSGSLHGYYFNSNDEGIRFGFSSTANSEDYSTTTVMQSVPSYGSVGARQANELQETLVIYTKNHAVTIGAIDNIIFRRISSGRKDTTVSYSEDVKGWVSFKSFIPENGVSLSKEYFTLKQGTLYQHYTSNNYNIFYGNPSVSTIKAVLNQSPSSVKSFNTINYEGTDSKKLAFVQFQSQVSATVVSDINADNALANNSDTGWYAQDISTDIESGSITEFIKKEGKWFNYIKGIKTSNFPSSDQIGSLSFQGLGQIREVDLTDAIPPSTEGSGV